MNLFGFSVTTSSKSMYVFLFGLGAVYTDRRFGVAGYYFKRIEGEVCPNFEIGEIIERIGILARNMNNLDLIRISDCVH